MQGPRWAPQLVDARALTNASGFHEGVRSPLTVSRYIEVSTPSLFFNSIFDLFYSSLFSDFTYRYSFIDWNFISNSKAVVWWISLPASTAPVGLLEGVRSPLFFFFFTSLDPRVE